MRDANVWDWLAPLLGTLFSKPKPKKARSSAVQIVTLYDQHGVHVEIQKFSDSFVYVPFTLLESIMHRSRRVGSGRS